MNPQTTQTVSPTTARAIRKGYNLLWALMTYPARIVAGILLTPLVALGYGLFGMGAGLIIWTAFLVLILAIFGASVFSLVLVIPVLITMVNRRSDIGRTLGRIFPSFR